MKKNYLFIMLVCCSLLFAGCPYQSSVPIDDASSSKIEQKLVGKWQKRSSEDETFVVKAKDDHTYTITDKHKKQKDAEQTPDDNYCGFITDVDGIKFLNIYKPDDDPKTYYFYKLELNDTTGGFNLYPVTEYITEKFESSADLMKFVKQYKGLSFFYETKDEYIKS